MWRGEVYGKMIFTVGVLAVVASGLEIHTGLSSGYEKLKGCNGIDILELTIFKAQAMYVDKKLTPLQLVECYIQRIEAMNPVLRAVLDVHPHARDMARAMPYPTREIIHHQPLYGVPILVKGNIAVAPLSNTGGANPLKHNKREDADVVIKLRKAGAIVFGTCNLSELAGARAFDAPDGWSHLGGKTTNPYHLNQTTSGSSSGSAVAVAANLALVSLGTETLGSVISPASRNMVVGFKPTYNWTSTEGIIPLAPSLDTVGILARTVQDSHIVMEALAEKKPNCSALELPKKIGIFSPMDNAGLKEKFNIASAYLKTKLHVDDRLMLSTDFVDLNAVMLFMYNEFKHHINQYLSPDNSLQAIINNHTTNSYPQETLKTVDKMDGDLKSINHVANKAKAISKVKTVIEAFMDKHNLDAVMIPTISNQHYLIIPDLAGFPVINIPAGLINSSIPQGLSLYAKQGHECMILSIGTSLEHLDALKRSQPNFYYVSETASTSYIYPLFPMLLLPLLIILW